MLSKAKQKRISKLDMKPRAKNPSKWIFLDISSQKKISLGGKQHWILILDDTIDHVFLNFLRTKDQLSSVVIPFINNLNVCNGLSVCFIRCDNDGKNIALERECEKAGFGIQFEYTVPNTPQQNS